MTETKKNALRVRVAELLGVKCLRCKGTGEYLRYGAHEWCRLRNYEAKGEQTPVKCDHITYDSRRPYQTLPDYPNDLNACAELIDLLANGLFNQQKIPHKWRGSFTKKIGAKEYCAWAETLATAICLAFVATMEEKQ